MAKTSYSKDELTALISETQKELRNLLKSEDAALQKGSGLSFNNGLGAATPPASSPPPAPVAKADEPSDKGPPKKDDDGDGDSKSDGPPSDASSSGPPPSDASSSAPPPDASASAPPASAPAPDASASADPSASAAPADPAGTATAGDSVETLKAAYAQLPPDQLKAHWMALKAIITAQTAAAPAAAAPGAPPAAPPASPPAAPMADASASLPPPGGVPPDMALKSEIEKTFAEKLSKFEAKNTELEKSLSTVTKAFELLMRKPLRKAITGKDLLPPPEKPAIDVTKLSAQDLAKSLAQVAKNPDLKKSERDLINGYFNKKVKAADLQVLFDKK